MGTLLLVTSIALILPVITSLIFQEDDLFALVITAAVTIAVGLPLWKFSSGNYELNFKDAVLIAVFGWVFISAISTIPFMVHGSIPSFTDSFFEMMSGYTTTGATILNNIESVPHDFYCGEVKLIFWVEWGFLL